MTDKPEDWMIRLKAAVDAGYYKDDTETDGLPGFPWQGKTCRDCPFYQSNEYGDGTCKVRALSRKKDAHTCRYFDEPNHEEAEQIIAQNDDQARRDWARDVSNQWWG